MRADGCWVLHGLVKGPGGELLDGDFFAVIYFFSVSCLAEPIADLWPRPGLLEVQGSKLEGQRPYSREQ